MKFVNYDRNYANHKQEIDEAINRCLTEGQLILRDEVEQFEKSFAQYVGTKYCVALNSGTDALYLALKAVKAKGDIAVPSHTFVATAQVVVQAGATPVLYDLDAEIPDTKVKLVAHMEGKLTELPEGLVIEDACQALGALKNPTSIAQAWSFYPAKTLGCYGDGGALTTNDKKIYEYVKEARNHFKTNYEDWGINSRLDNIQAAILNVKLKYIDEYIQKRLEIAQLYDDYITNPLIFKPKPRKVYQDYVIRCNNRDELYEHMKLKGIETMKNEYPMPIGKLPKAGRYEGRSLRIPCNPEMRLDEILEVISALNEFKVLQ